MSKYRVYINGQIYVFGGWNGKGYVNYGFLYSTDKMNMLVEKNKDRIVSYTKI